MRKFWLILWATTLTILSIQLIPQAQAQSSIILTEPTHQQIGGEFIDDDLAQTLKVTGRLGALVFNPPQGNITWIIDPSLIEAVQAMANGYLLTSGIAGTGQEIAKSWLQQLVKVTDGSRVAALAYGNPSRYWVSQLSPHEVNYVLDISAKKIASALPRSIKLSPLYLSNSQFAITSADISIIKSDSQFFDQTAEFVDPTNIDTYRLGLIKILNPYLTKDRRDYLIRDYTRAAYNQVHQVHLSPGKFTVTSAHQKLPITISNGFPNPVKLNLYVFPTNLKVQVASLPQVTVPAQSKIQVMVPITVLTSGTSGLNVEITSVHGNLLGDSVIYPLQLSVISPIATWFTTGGAIALFLAASIQSIWRIRRRRS
jgi:hypothetical protein